jgi:glycosyltransferase involved in cell wall biosynthesis
MPAIKVVHMTSVHTAVDHRVFRKECRSLARAGFDVTLVVTSSEDAMVEGIKIKAIEKPRSRFARMTRTVWSVYREAQKLDADVYHFHDPELIPAALLLRGRGKKVIYDIHEDYPRDILYKNYLPKWTRRIVARLAEFIEGAVCRHFSALVTVTPAIAARFAELNHRTVVVCNYPYPEELASESAVSWDARKIAATYVGTVTPQRGIAQMIGAMALLPEALEAKLEMAGDEIPAEFQKLPGWSSVRYHGGLPQLETYKLLRSVRVGLIVEHPIPTFIESMPVKVFEYMGAGLPVVASNFPFWRKMLGDERCVIFVDPLNVREVAQAVEYLLTHPEEAAEMGRRGQAAVERRFNWNTEAQKLVDLYRDLVSQKCAA